MHIWNHRHCLFNGNKIITHPVAVLVTKTKELKDSDFLPHNPEMMHPINTVK
jgi:hypothetical protein